MCLCVWEDVWAEKKSVALDMSKSIMWNCSLYFHYFYSFGSQIYFHSKAFTLASKERFWIFLFYSFQHYLNRSEEELLCDLAKFQSHFMLKWKRIFHSLNSLEPYYISSGWIVCVHVKSGDMNSNCDWNLNYC